MKRPRQAPSNWLGRALTGFALGLGLGAIVLSFVPAATRSAATTIVPTEDAPDLTQPASPAHAAAASRSGSGTQTVSAADPLLRPTPRPVVRQAAPSEALPAINARSIGAGQASGPAAPAAPAPPAPFSVVVVLEDQASLGKLGQAIVGGLNQLGIMARLAALKDAGRPDAILLVNGVAGGRNEAWFCDPGPEQSTTMALALLAATGAGSSGPAADAPRRNFPCEDIHAGRARVPAVLLELADGGSATDANAIVSTFDAYFKQQRSQVLAARNAPRLIWPANGPVTSHYGPSHPLGVDIGQSQGAIVAATDGVVDFAGGNACCSYGYHVVVESPDGVGSLYAHLSSISVAVGQRVRQGQVLGVVGCTGTCFGTHLHFEVFLDGRRQDPMRFLP